MKVKLLSLAVALAVSAVALPVMAYHIDGNGPVVGPIDPTLTTGDWHKGTGTVVIVCESEGPIDDADPSLIGPLHGQGGLCYTGENDYTCISPPHGAAGQYSTVGRAFAPGDLRAFTPPSAQGIYNTENQPPSAKSQREMLVGPLGLGGDILPNPPCTDPAVAGAVCGIVQPFMTSYTPGAPCGTTTPAAVPRAACGQTGIDSDDVVGGCIPANVGGYIRIDTCEHTVKQRSGGAVGPFVKGGHPACPTPQTRTQSWFAEIGAFACFIGDGDSPLGDQALYYDRLYAWWSYEAFGDGMYTIGDVKGNVHTGDGAPNNLPGVYLPLPSDTHSAFHGHVAMFIDDSDQSMRPPGDLTGSSVTQYMGTGPFPFDDSVGGAGVLTAFPCGESPYIQPDSADVDGGVLVDIAPFEMEGGAGSLDPPAEGFCADPQDRLNELTGAAGSLECEPPLLRRDFEHQNGPVFIGPGAFEYMG